MHAGTPPDERPGVNGAFSLPETPAVPLIAGGGPWRRTEGARRRRFEEARSKKRRKARNRKNGKKCGKQVVS